MPYTNDTGCADGFGMPSNIGCGSDQLDSQTFRVTRWHDCDDTEDKMIRKVIVYELEHIYR